MVEAPSETSHSFKLLIFKSLPNICLKKERSLGWARVDQTPQTHLLYSVSQSCSYPNPSPGKFRKHLRQDRSTSALLTFWTRSFLMVRGCPVQCRMLSSIPRPYPLDEVAPLTQSNDQRCFWMLPKAPGMGLGAGAGGDPLLRTTDLRVFKQPPWGPPPPLRLCTLYSS